MKTFMLVLAIVSHDPSRPTRSVVLAHGLSKAACVELGLIEHWRRNVPARELRCEPDLQQG
jgi:hypothetical protein